MLRIGNVLHRDLTLPLRMRIRGFRGRAHEVRRALLPGCDPFHSVRSGNRLSLSLGGDAQGDREPRLLVDDDLPCRPRGGLRLRVDEGSAGMGIARMKMVYGY